MREAVTHAGAHGGALLDETCIGRFFQRAEETVLRHARHRLQDVEAELPADHRGDPKKLVAVAAHTGKTLADHVPQTLRDAHGNSRRTGVPTDPTGQTPLLQQVAQYLLDEERVSLCLTVDSLGDAP